MNKKTIIQKLKNHLPLFIIAGFFLIYIIINRGFPCIFRQTIGIPCPGCGITRAYSSLAHGHIKESFFWHPLWPLLTLIIVLYALYSIKRFSFVRNTINHFTQNHKIMSGIICGIVLLLVIGVYIYRMYRYFPNTDPMSLNHNAYLLRLGSWVKNLF